MLKLSILDQCQVQSGATPALALRDSVRLAQLGERLGYHRYWVAEHHGSESFASGSPEILVAHIASATQRIRVGSGGVMLMHYSPYKVAENFKLLQTLYPGRVDLGVGRAPGGDGRAAAALAYGSRVGVEYLPAKIADLKAFVRDQAPLTEALAPARAMPRVELPPELWLLGSSPGGAMLAAELGMRFSYAHFFSPAQAQDACAAYREHFVPSPEEPEPQLNLGVHVLCAESEAKVEQLARCRDLWHVRALRGETPPYPSEDEAKNHPWTQQELAQVEAGRSQLILGTPTRVAEQLCRLTASTGAEELMILTIAPQFEDRARCYELLARELLRGRAGPRRP
jgi:luciferase family oxidoreductase group 1